MHALLQDPSVPYSFNSPNAVSDLHWPGALRPYTQTWSRYLLQYYPHHDAKAHT